MSSDSNDAVCALTPEQEWGLSEFCQSLQTLTDPPLPPQVRAVQDGLHVAQELKLTLAGGWHTTPPPGSGWRAMLHGQPQVGWNILEIDSGAGRKLFFQIDAHGVFYAGRLQDGRQDLAFDFQATPAGWQIRLRQATGENIRLLPGLNISSGVWTAKPQLADRPSREEVAAYDRRLPPGEEAVRPSRDSFAAEAQATERKAEKSPAESEPPPRAQSLPAAASQATMVESLPLSWQIMIHTGPGQPARRLPLGDRAAVGRELDNDIRISDPKISRHHAVLERLGDGYRLADLNSRNGTFVNGQRVRQPVLVKHGDIIAIGEARLTLIDPSQATASSDVARPLVAAQPAQAPYPPSPYPSAQPPPQPVIYPGQPSPPPDYRPSPAAPYPPQVHNMPPAYSPYPSTAAPPPTYPYPTPGRKDYVPPLAEGPKWWSCALIGAAIVLGVLLLAAVLVVILTALRIISPNFMLP